MPARPPEERLQNFEAKKTEEDQRGVTACFRRIKNQDVGEADQKHRKESRRAVPARADEPSQGDRARAGHFRKNPIARPIAMLAQEINEEAVQVMIVVVMRLGENADRGMEFPHKLNRPDLVHPKIIQRGADSDYHRASHDQRRDRPVEERVGSARGSQC